MFWTGVVIGMIAGIVIGGAVGTVAVALTRAAKEGDAIPPGSTLFGYSLPEVRWMVSYARSFGARPPDHLREGEYWGA